MVSIEWKGDELKKKPLPKGLFCARLTFVSKSREFKEVAKHGFEDENKVVLL